MDKSKNLFWGEIDRDTRGVLQVMRYGRSICEDHQLYKGFVRQANRMLIKWFLVFLILIVSVFALWVWFDAWFAGLKAGALSMVGWARMGAHKTEMFFVFLVVEWICNIALPNALIATLLFGYFTRFLDTHWAKDRALSEFQQNLASQTGMKAMVVLRLLRLVPKDQKGYFEKVAQAVEMQSCAAAFVGQASDRLHADASQKRLIQLREQLKPHIHRVRSMLGGGPEEVAVYHIRLLHLTYRHIIWKPCMFAPPLNLSVSEECFWEG